MLLRPSAHYCGRGGVKVRDITDTLNFIADAFTFPRWSFSLTTIN